ncbi:STAS domain-containing protein [Pseudactinotalea sp. Z1739]|uniref:STAS domain-containing protein n=1 Tax=Pseudactinotalea sp. Z1739 TaxID=3413028 RepID=UPI003C7A289E
MSPSVGGAIEILDVSTARLHIVISGELDCMITARARELIGPVREAATVAYVDASAVTFVDASGLSAITALATSSGRKPVLIQPPAIMRFLLQVTGLKEVFTVDPGPHGSHAGGAGGHGAGVHGC